ncbi:MAG TPA: lactate utilization protein [Desulfuromonadales bacterium]|nr:lactate utilization protein [Desulfuromonadales bacterium]
MYDAFKERAIGVGAEVHRFATKGEATDFILAFLQKEEIADIPGSCAVWAESPFLDGVGKTALQQIAGIGFEVNRTLAAEARVGISQMDWALADTGSLVQDQSAVEKRLVSSLPAIHLALVPTANILEGKKALFERLNPRTSSYIAFITGPSRTADIERVLTIGVHGPQRLIIVFVDELGGGIS